MNGTKPRPKRRWWQRPQATQTEEIVDAVLDDEVLRLMDEVESEFKMSFEYHTRRLAELKEALRVRQEQDRSSRPART